MGSNGDGNGSGVKLTLGQLKGLAARLESAGASEVEIVQGQDDRLQFYVVETKVVRRPLKRLAKTGGE